MAQVEVPKTGIFKTFQIQEFAVFFNETDNLMKAKNLVIKNKQPMIKQTSINYAEAKDKNDYKGV